MQRSVSIAAVHLVLIVIVAMAGALSPVNAQEAERPHDVASHQGDVIATSLGTNFVSVLRAGAPVDSLYLIDVGAPSWGVCVSGDSA